MKSTSSESIMQFYSQFCRISNIESISLSNYRYPITIYIRSLIYSFIFDPRTSHTSPHYKRRLRRHAPSKKYSKEKMQENVARLNRSLFYNIDGDAILTSKLREQNAATVSHTKTQCFRTHPVARFLRRRPTLTFVFFVVTWSASPFPEVKDRSLMMIAPDDATIIRHSTLAFVTRVTDSHVETRR